MTRRNKKVKQIQTFSEAMNHKRIDPLGTSSIGLTMQNNKLAYLFQKILRILQRALIAFPANNKSSYGINSKTG